MKNVAKLKKYMRPGQAYRRQSLKGVTTDVDRDLQKLVCANVVKKLSAGLYYRPKKNAFGDHPPENSDLVKAFLKTDDFLLTSYNHFNQLSLGLTQLYNNTVVYNHKRTGNFRLGGKRFFFRVVPSFPHKLSKEFLLVDFLNNLHRLPDNTSLALHNLKSHLRNFNRKKLEKQLSKYGRPSALRAYQTYA